MSREDGQSSERCKRLAQPGGPLFGQLRTMEESTIPGGSREGQAAEQGAKKDWVLDLVPSLVSSLSLSHLDMVGRGLCHSAPLTPPQGTDPAQSPAGAQDRRDGKTGASSSLVSLFIPMPAEETLQKNPKSPLNKPQS